MVEFWEDDNDGWVARFFVREEGSIAGKGLFAARDYASGEYLTVYMGTELGNKDSVEGLRARAELNAMKRADHVMEVGGKWVDGRVAVGGRRTIFNPFRTAV